MGLRIIGNLDQSPDYGSCERPLTGLGLGGRGWDGPACRGLMPPEAAQALDTLNPKLV